MKPHRHVIPTPYQRLRLYVSSRNIYYWFQSECAMHDGSWTTVPNASIGRQGPDCVHKTVIKVRELVRQRLKCNWTKLRHLDRPVCLWVGIDGLTVNGIYCIVRVKHPWKTTIMTLLVALNCFLSSIGKFKSHKGKNEMSHSLSFRQHIPLRVLWENIFIQYRATPMRHLLCYKLAFTLGIRIQTHV